MTLLCLIAAEGTEVDETLRHPGYADPMCIYDDDDEDEDDVFFDTDDDDDSEDTFDEFDDFDENIGEDDGEAADDDDL